MGAKKNYRLRFVLYCRSVRISSFYCDFHRRSSQTDLFNSRYSLSKFRRGEKSAPDASIGGLHLIITIGISLCKFHLCSFWSIFVPIEHRLDSFSSLFGSLRTLWGNHFEYSAAIRTDADRPGRFGPVRAGRRPPRSARPDRSPARRYPLPPSSARLFRGTTARRGRRGSRLRRAPSGPAGRRSAG